MMKSLLILHSIFLLLTISLFSHCKQPISYEKYSLPKWDNRITTFPSVSNSLRLQEQLQLVPNFRRARRSPSQTPDGGEIKIEPYFGPYQVMLANQGIPVEKSKLQEWKETYKSEVSMETIRKYEGIGGTHEFVSGISTKADIVTSDHGPPQDLYKHAKYPSITKLSSGAMASLSMRDYVHKKLITTGGKADDALMELSSSEREAVYLNPLYKLNTRSSYFNSELAVHFKNGDFREAVEKQVRAWEWSWKEGRAHEVKYVQGQLPLDTSLGDTVDPKKINVLHGGLELSSTLGDLLESLPQVDGQYLNSGLTVKDLLKQGFTVPEELGSKPVSNLIPGGLMTSDELQRQLTGVLDSHMSQITKQKDTIVKAKDSIQPKYLSSDSHITEEGLRLPAKEVFKPDVASRLPSTEILGTITLKELLDGSSKPLPDVPLQKLLKVNVDPAAVKEFGARLKDKQYITDHGVSAGEILDIKSHFLGPPGLAVDRIIAQNVYRETGIHFFNPETTLADLLPPGTELTDDDSFVGKVFTSETARSALVGTGITDDMALKDIFDLSDSKLPDVSKLDLGTKVQAVLKSQLKLSSSEFSTNLLDFHAIVDSSYENMKQGVRVAAETSFKNFYNDDYVADKYGEVWDSYSSEQKDNFRMTQIENSMNEITEKYNLRYVKPEVLTPEQLDKRKVTDQWDEYKKALSVCGGGGGSRRKKRSAEGGGSCCICAVKKRPKEMLQQSLVDEDLDEDTDGGMQGKKPMTEAGHLQELVHFKQSFESGDIVHKLIETSDEFNSGKPSFIDSEVEQIDTVQLDKVQIGKGSFKSLITQEFHDPASHEPRIAKRPLQKFGSKVYEAFEDAGKVTGVINKVFMFRNLANGIRREDVSSVATTLGMLGAGKLGNYLSNTGKAGKSIAGLNSAFIKNAGSAIGTGLDLVGIGFDIYSITHSVKCLEQGADNKLKCEEEAKALSTGIQEKILAVLEKSGCASDFDICGGKDATVDIIANGISIGMNAIGMACAPCKPVTDVIDFVVTKLNEMFQAGMQIAAFKKVIELSDAEMVGEYFQLMLGIGFSEYLLALKNETEIQTQVLDGMTAFLLKNPGFFAIISAKKFTKGDPSINRPEETLIDLRGGILHNVVVQANFGAYKRERWTPSVRDLRGLDLFCPPLMTDADQKGIASTVNPSAICVDSYGLRNTSRDFANTSAIIHLAFHTRSSFGMDLVWGFRDSQNVFVFGRNPVKILGGRRDDRFVVVGGCCPMGSLDGGEGVDTLDLSDAHGSLGGIQRLDFQAGKLYFNPMQLLRVAGIEVVVGTAGTPQSLVASCDLISLSLGGGQKGGEEDLVEIPRGNCTHKLFTEVGVNTRVVSNGSGNFTWRVIGAGDVRLEFGGCKLEEEPPSHNILLDFSYLDILEVTSCSLKHVTMVLRTEFLPQINLRIADNESCLSLGSSGGIPVVTKAAKDPGRVQLPAKLRVLQEEGDNWVDFLLHVDVNEDAYFTGEGRTLEVQGSRTEGNTFVLHPAGPKWLERRRVAVVGGSRRNTFILSGLLQGFLNAGGNTSLNSLHFSSFQHPQLPSSILKVDLLSRAVLFGGKLLFGLGGEGVFNEILGRLNETDVVVCGCGQSYIDLRGGGGPYSPDKVFLPLSPESCEVNRRLAVRLWNHTYVQNGRDGGEFDYHVTSNHMNGILLNFTSPEADEAEHNVFLHFSVSELGGVELIGDSEAVISHSQKARGSVRISVVGVGRMGGPLAAQGLRVILLDDVGGVRLLQNEGQPTLVFSFARAERLKGKNMFAGHPEISNIFRVTGDLPLRILAGGAGNDSFSIVDPSVLELQGHGGLNSLDLSQMRAAGVKVHVDFILGQMDFVSLTNYNVSTTDSDTDALRNNSRTESVLQKFTDFQFILGSPGGTENVMVACDTEFVDTNGSEEEDVEFIFVPPGRNCSNDPTLRVAVGRRTLLLVGESSGHFTYEVNVPQAEDGMDLTVYCFHQDLTFGLCYGSTHNVDVDLPLKDFTWMEVTRSPGGHKTLSLVYRGYIKFNFTLQLLDKAAVVHKGFPPEWTSLLPSDEELEESGHESPSAVDPDELLRSKSRLDLRQETFNIRFGDGSAIGVSRLDRLTISQQEEDCAGQARVGKLLEDKKLLAFKFGAGIIVSCPKLVLIVGGDEVVDFLENIPGVETHLQGNFGLETVFSIVPSKYRTILHLSESDDTRNILDLSEFFGDTGFIPWEFIPTVSETPEGDLLLEIFGQSVILSGGIAVHERLSVVLRYTEFRFAQMAKKTGRQKKEASSKWTLLQKNWSPAGGKEIVYLSMDDLDTADPVLFIPNQATIENAIFRLEDNAVVVTNMFTGLSEYTHLSVIIHSTADQLTNSVSELGKDFLETNISSHSSKTPKLPDKRTFPRQLSIQFGRSGERKVLDNSALNKLPDIAVFAFWRFYWKFLILSVILLLFGLIVLLLVVLNRHFVSEYCDRVLRWEYTSCLTSSRSLRNVSGFDISVTSIPGLKKRAVFIERGDLVAFKDLKQSLSNSYRPAEATNICIPFIDALENLQESYE